MPKGIYKHKPLSKKHKEKIKESLQGRIFTKEHRKKLSIANKQRKPPSFETRQKMSQAQKNSPYYKQQIARLKIINIGRNSPLKKEKIIRKGYIYLHKPKHPFATKQGYFAEHRFVMERFLNRILNPKERVHHKGIKYPINSIENKQDNRIENLQLFENVGKHCHFHFKLTHS